MSIEGNFEGLEETGIYIYSSSDQKYSLILSSGTLFKHIHKAREFQTNRQKVWWIGRHSIKLRSFVGESFHLFRSLAITTHEQKELFIWVSNLGCIIN